MDERCARCGFPPEECDCPSPLRRFVARVNPWSTPTVAPATGDRQQWEFVPIVKTAERHPDLYRIRVPGGWLYRLGIKSTELTFVPDR